MILSQSVERILRKSHSTVDKPLAGIRVLECGHIVGGPFAGTILSYFGAQVIKIEPPGRGDQVRDYRFIHGETKTSYWWYSIGRNKHSISIDLKTCAGRQLLKDLATDADVLIENFKPGRMEAWGLGPQDLPPHLVYSRISGYGQSGPYSQKPGFASVCEAMGGLRYVNGFPGEPSVRPNLSLGDSLAGLHAALGIVIALLGRQRGVVAKEDRHVKGQGQVVDVAIYEAVFNMMEAVVPEYSGTGTIRGPSGSTVTGIVPSNTFLSEDHKSVVIGANTDSLFKTLMITCGYTSMAKDAKFDNNTKRVTHQAFIDDQIAIWARQHSAESIIKQLEKVGIPVGLIYNVEDMVKNEQYQARGMFENTTIGNEQELQLPAICPKLESTPGSTEWAGQKLGQDTVKILETCLHLSKEDIQTLIDDKIIYQSTE